MSCDGASKEFAIIKSKQAFDEIIQLMKEKYYVERPVIMNSFGFEKKMQKEWDQEEKVLRSVLADLFWTSDAASF